MLRCGLAVRCSLVLVVMTAESWGLLIGGVFMDAKTAQVWGCVGGLGAQPKLWKADVLLPAADTIEVDDRKKSEWVQQA